MHKAEAEKLREALDRAVWQQRGSSYHRKARTKHAEKTERKMKNINLPREYDCDWVGPRSRAK